MFFIAGTRGVTTTVSKGKFFCPECNVRTNYHHNQVHQKATVFFIPVLNLKLLGEYIECQNCSNTYKMEMLDYDPEQEREEFEALYLTGIKKVMVMMILADGKVDEKEKIMMKGIYQKITNSELSDSDIEKEIENSKTAIIGLEDLLTEVFPQLNESGRETIIKVAYWVSVADGKVDKEEQQLLIKLAKHFQISSAHLKGIISEVDELSFKG